MRKQLELNQLTLYDADEAMQRIQEEKMASFGEQGMEEEMPMVSDRTTDEEEAVKVKGEEDPEKTAPKPLMDM